MVHNQQFTNGAKRPICGYMKNINDIDVRRRRLRFRCWHRGTKEADMLLGRFADAYIEKMEPAELDQLEVILGHNDLDLYNWISGNTPWPANVVCDLTERLSRFCAEGGHR